MTIGGSAAHAPDRMVGSTARLRLCRVVHVDRDARDCVRPMSGAGPRAALAPAATACRGGGLPDVIVAARGGGRPR